MIAKLFWIVVTLEALGLIWFGIKLVKETNRGGPEAGLGILALLLVVGAIGALGLISFWYYKSQSVSALILVLLPIVVQGIGSLRSWKVDRQVQVVLAGNEDFSDPLQRALANAINRKDVAAVRAAIPGAGDLNRRSGTGQTMLMFAVGPGASPEIIKLLLEAGANPNVTRGDGLHPLQLSGEGTTRLLVEAGADPNAKGTEGTVWLNALTIDTAENREALELFLKRGANMAARNHRGEGPAGTAAQAKNWHGLVRVLESGASHDDVVLGESLRAHVKWHLANEGSQASDDLKKAARLLGH